MKMMFELLPGPEGAIDVHRNVSGCPAFVTVIVVPKGSAAVHVLDHMGEQTLFSLIDVSVTVPVENGDRVRLVSTSERRVDIAVSLSVQVEVP